MIARDSGRETEQLGLRTSLSELGTYLPEATPCLLLCMVRTRKRQ